MMEEVQRHMAGLNFRSGGKTGYNYPAVGQSNQPRNSPSQQTVGLQSALHPSSQPQPPYSHAPAEHPRPGYSQPQPPYNHPPAEHSRPGYSPPYPPYGQQSPYQAPTGPYQHPQQAPSQDYGQPAYPGWRGPYYNSHQPQQPGSHLPPPYNAPSPYPLQGNYYRPQ